MYACSLGLKVSYLHLASQTPNNPALKSSLLVGGEAMKHILEGPGLGLCSCSSCQRPHSWLPQKLLLLAEGYHQRCQISVDSL